jgi:predicted regulator of Ras-like GTPase activity (Roadblock/LC7/MglB family)
MSRNEELKKEIDTLRGAIPELKGVLIASNEGLPVAHSLSGSIDANRVAAMAAAASSLGRRVTDSLGVGALNEISVTAADGQIYLYSAGPKAVLAVIGPTGGNAGLVHLEARSVATQIGQLF